MITDKQLILKGIGASRGIAQGNVKIINDIQDIDKFNQDDVLVTKITDPSMVMIMAKASAIVTDIGSLTSHPAIVSREMGTPCIVAVKYATTKLKDGMEITVNGNTGEIFSSNKYTDVFDKDCEEMLEAYRKAYSTMDTNTFDVSVDYVLVDPLIAKVWINKLLNIINKAIKDNIPAKKIAQLFPNASALRNIVIFDLFMASYAKINNEDKLKIAKFLINTLKALCKSHPFALDNQNIIHDDADIKKMTSNVRLANPQIAKKLGRLINACYQLSYGLYGDMNPQIIYDNYGPYYVIDKSNQKYLAVIKEFKNFKPIEFWPETKDIPFEKIRIVNLYKDVEFTIDAITHTNYHGDNINGLKYFSLEIDDKIVKVENIDEVITTLEEYAAMIWANFKKLNLEEVKIKYLHQKAYNYKKLCQLLSINWLPDDKLINEIKNKPLKKWPEFSNAEEKDEFFLKIIDPRTDFSG